MAKKKNKNELTDREIKEGVIRKYFEQGISYCGLYEELTEVLGWRPTHADFLATILLNAVTNRVPKDTANNDILYIVDIVNNSSISEIKGLIRLRHYQKDRDFKMSLFKWRDLDKESISWFMMKQDASLDGALDYERRKMSR